MLNQKIVSVLGVIFSPDRKQVLLTKRADVPVWVLPGGGVHPEESLEMAIRRELQEELGVPPHQIQHVATYHTQGPFLKPTALFCCTLNTPPQLQSDEVTAIQYFALTHLPPLPPFFPEFIQDALQATDTLQEKTLVMTYNTVLKTFLRHPRLVTRFLWIRVKKALTCCAD